MIRRILHPVADRLRYWFPIPTARTTAFVAAAFLLYLFGNQTQVGWMFIMSALLGGTVLAAWWLNRGTLRRVAVERQVGDVPGGELYEGDVTTVSLALRNAGRGGTAHVVAAERCPLAAPESPEWEMALFVPHLPGRAAARFDYAVEIDRRGVHAFPPLELTSRAPFGFFRRHRRIAAPTPVLVYPEVRPLHHLALLDYRLVPQVAYPRAGVGTEILGVRPYRSGDSPRRIHWRSVARTGRLISKEFVDETRPGLTLLLDVCQHPYPSTVSKHMPFEWAVKVAASVGAYALRRGYPLHLLADADAWPAPAGPLDRRALLEFLARVQPTGGRPLAEVLARSGAPSSPCVVVILPWPDATVAATLAELHGRGLALLVVLLDPASFPSEGPSAGPLADALGALGLEVRLVRFGQDWREQISPQQESISVSTYVRQERPQQARV